ncbi:AMP-binding protein [Alkalibacillus salilacus]|uniref:Fatty-acyl-CoA synthase n=1 Tax=Alkalibacillus salilacus TaxID=284582 RepID=A0ABT9VD53_9BACI|nr:AMP-binding protein [Alkalibacillus salilacus]MDQ0158906.1 fatty-acyl-CoA synthase [Alkalibacillus salilacus]
MPLTNLTIGELIEQQANNFPDYEAAVYPEKGIRWTYKQFNEEVNRVAKGFMAFGIDKGDHVAIWADNKPEWLTSQFATGKMGAVLVTVNTSYQAQELEYLLKQSESSTLILAESFKGTSYIDIVKELIPDLANQEKGNIQSDKFPHLKNIIVLSDKSYVGCYTWHDVVQASDHISDEELTQRLSSLNEHDVINMQYTSGTTGFPKGVMLSHYNIVNNGKQIAECMSFTEQDRLCIPVPFFHCFGCVLGTLAAVSKAATMVVVEQFDPEKVLAAVSEEQCTALHGVPTMFIAELNHPNFNDYEFPHLRTGIMAGSNCPIDVMKDVMENMGASEITITYGQTESSPAITQTTTDDPIERKVSTVGKQHPNVEVKIVEPGTNQEVKTNEPGELCTRGYHVMQGYYNNEEETRNAIDSDGWLHTGDIAEIDDEGYVKITGRMKDMVIRGGENIYPREIEEFLIQHDDVLDVQVVGVPDAKYGEELMAWTILKEDSTLTEDGLKDYCRGHIAYHKVPRYIQFTDEYPMTASGKVQKFKLRQQAEDLIAKD